MTGELVLFRPSRLVTRQWCGWWLTQGPDGQLGYTTSALYGHGDVLTMGQVRKHELFGGWLRPVVPPQRYELELVQAALFDAGRLGVTTLARALWRCVQAVGIAALVAGRSGSWESSTMTQLALWGQRVDPGRVHWGAANAVQDQVLLWVDSPHRYVEVAETLSVAFSTMAMRHLSVQINTALDEGEQLDPFTYPLLLWQSVADRPLWPDSYEGAALGKHWHQYLMHHAIASDGSWFDRWPGSR